MKWNVDVLRSYFSLFCAEEDMLTFDLQSLATLAAARALEMAPPTTTDSTPPLRRILNLRRKCKWTPRPEPVQDAYVYSFIHSFWFEAANS